MVAGQGLYYETDDPKKRAQRRHLWNAAAQAFHAPLHTARYIYVALCLINPMQSIMAGITTRPDAFMLAPSPASGCFTPSPFASFCRQETSGDSTGTISYLPAPGPSIQLLSTIWPALSMPLLVAFPAVLDGAILRRVALGTAPSYGEARRILAVYVVPLHTIAVCILGVVLGLGSRYAVPSSPGMYTALPVCAGFKTPGSCGTLGGSWVLVLLNMCLQGAILACVARLIWLLRSAPADGAACVEEGKQDKAGPSMWCSDVRLAR